MAELIACTLIVWWEAIWTLTKQFVNSYQHVSQCE